MNASAQAAPRSKITSTHVVLACTAALALAIGLRNGVVAIVDSLVTGSMWALIAVGLALVFGVMNVPNFAQGEFFMIGTLSAYLTFSHTQDIVPFHWLRPFVTIAIATLVGAVVGVVIDLIVFRPLRRRAADGWVMNSFVVTVALSTILINGHQMIWGPDFKGIANYWSASVVHVLGVSVGVDRLVVFGIATVTIALLWAALRFLEVGRAIRAVASDEVGARMVGIDIPRIHALTFGVSSGLAALAGSSLLFLFPSSPYVGVVPLSIAWTVVILVGLGNIGGAILGGFIVALFQTGTAYTFGSNWTNVVPLVLIVVILVIRPNGLFGQSVGNVWAR